MIPEGWMLVPIKPNEDMIEGSDFLSRRTAIETWAGYLSGVPPVPAMNEKPVFMNGAPEGASHVWNRGKTNETFYRLAGQGMEYFFTEGQEWRESSYSVDYLEGLELVSHVETKPKQRVADDSVSLLCFRKLGYYVEYDMTSVKLRFKGKVIGTFDSCWHAWDYVQKQHEHVLASEARQQPHVDDGLFEDIFTHREAWREALVAKRNAAEPSSVDTDDKGYWQHQLDAFDRVCEAIR